MSIGAINYSSVQGRIALGSVVYTSKNISVSLVRCLVTVRYWRRHVQTSWKNEDRLPPRLNVHMTGLEVQIFNNSDKFDALAQLKKQRSPGDQEREHQATLTEFSLQRDSRKSSQPQC